MQNHVTVIIGEGHSDLHYARIEDGYVVCGANADRSEDQFLSRYASGGGFCIHCAAAVR